MLENIPKELLLEALKVSIENKTIPQYLFKYRATDGQNNEFTEKIISQNELYFSKPADFNDWFDCKPIIDIFTKEELQQFVKKEIGCDISEKN